MVVRRRLCAAPVPQSSLLLDQFAKKTNRPEISAKLAEYIEAKSQFDGLIDRYEIFAAKQVSTADAARMVGLQLPKTPSSSQ